MDKLYINSRDELVCVDVASIALLKADGNYTQIYYIDNKDIKKPDILVSKGVSVLFNELKKFNNKKTHLLKISRSVIVNDTFTRRIKLDNRKSLLVMGDGCGNGITVDFISKAVLKNYKDVLAAKVEIKAKRKNEI